MSEILRTGRAIKLQVCDDDTLGRLAARTVERLVAEKPDAVIGLATGSSPVPLYEALAENKPNLSDVRWFALDEYVGLPAGHPQSYAETIRREVCDPLGLDTARVHLPDVHRPDLAQAAADYENLIRGVGGVDLQVIGLGHNGHLAFNEPGTAFGSRTRVEALADRTRRANARFFPSLADVPTHCVTQGLATILDARRLLLIVRGADKAEILHRALTGPVSPNCPGSVLQLHPDVIAFADPEAAARLMPALAEVQG